MRFHKKILILGFSISAISLLLLFSTSLFVNLRLYLLYDIAKLKVQEYGDRFPERVSNIRPNIPRAQETPIKIPPPIVRKIGEVRQNPDAKRVRPSKTNNMQIRRQVQFGAMQMNPEQKRYRYPKREDMGECHPVHGKITVLVLFNDKIRENYQIAQESLHCYLRTTRYNFIAVHLDKDERVQQFCKHQKNLFFKKHCAVLAYLNETDWMYVMDADTGVVNPNHCIEEWIDDRVDIIFYERFWSFEITAGNYFIRNSWYARSFLNKWAQWEFLPFPGDKLEDNGSLHMVILQMLVPEAKPEIKACENMYKNVKFENFTTYFAFISCFKNALGSARLWPGKIRIYRKAHGWARDGHLTGEAWSDSDFMMHGWKTQSIDDGNWTSPFDKKFNLDECGIGYGGWHWKTDKKRTIEEIRESLSNYERNLQKGFEKSARIAPWLDGPNIGDCYPNCEEGV